MVEAVLFVDDEPNILLGLKRMLRSMRNEMDFYFVESGEEALAFLEKKEINVIVSDMRMPGMDGAALLTRVKMLYPQIIRIMLTGHADDNAILKTIPVVHQFLAKPSDPQSLKETLTRACALQKLILSKKLKTLVAGLGTLPSLPKIYMELQEKIKDPQCAIRDVAALIEKDIAMSTKVLQLVNSAFYGLYTRVESPARAVSLLGLDTIKALVLDAGIFTEMSHAGQHGFSITALSTHSFTTAKYAKTIALSESANTSTVDNAFVAGIVHDVGKLLLFSCLGVQYVQAIELAKTHAIHLFEAERKVFEADHGDVGGYLLSLWALPGPVVEAVAFHHRLEEYPEASFCPALAVHAADVAYAILNPDQCVGKPPRINDAYLEQAGLGGRFSTWLKHCRECK